MRVVAFEEAGTFTLAGRPKSTAGYKKVGAEVATVGVCGTNIHVLDGENACTIFRIAPGQEATAISSKIDCLASMVTELSRRVELLPQRRRPVTRPSGSAPMKFESSGSRPYSTPCPRGQDARGRREHPRADD